MNKIETIEGINEKISYDVMIGISNISYTVGEIRRVVEKNKELLSSNSKECKILIEDINDTSVNNYSRLYYQVRNIKSTLIIGFIFMGIGIGSILAILITMLIL